MLESNLFAPQDWSPLNVDRKLDSYLKELETDREAVEKARKQIAQQTKELDPFEGTEYQ
jgi:hypothetical protein